MSPGKITGADVVPVSLLSGDFFPCFVGSATQVYCRPLSVTFFRTCNKKRKLKLNDDKGVTITAWLHETTWAVGEPAREVDRVVGEPARAVEEVDRVVEKKTGLLGKQSILLGEAARAVGGSSPDCWGRGCVRNATSGYFRHAVSMRILALLAARSS